MERLTHPLIAPPLALQYSRIMKEELDRSHAGSKRILNQAAKRLENQFKKVQSFTERGHLADRIIAKAKREKSDLIILGSRGLSNIQIFLLGSVSLKVATHAPCSVLIVKRRSRFVKKMLVAVDGSRYSDVVVKFLSKHFTPGKLRGVVFNAWDYFFTPLDIRWRPLEKSMPVQWPGQGLRWSQCVSQVIRQPGLSRPPVRQRLTLLY